LPLEPPTTPRSYPTPQAAGTYADLLEKIAVLIEEKKIKPVIDRVFSFSRANEALAYVEKGRSRGKTIVSLTI
jgi:NADPH:quinone reductase-like Zn-dependent oxidoreductase